MRVFVALATLTLLATVGATPTFALGDDGGRTRAVEADLPDTGDATAGDASPEEPDPSPDEPVGATAAQEDSGPQLSGEELVGTFELDEGTCEQPAGTYFRMVQPDGEPGEGPYVSNADSPCDDDTVTPLQPGTDGGLSTERHQPHPDEAFSATGDGQAEAIIEPQEFFGVDFAAATNPVDPQTEVETPEPVIVHDGAGTLEGDVRPFGVAWNRQHFNQGAPKPDGGTGGHTEAPTGTYDPDTGAFSLSWSSEIEGGPFDGFTGEWHLEGTFVSAAGTGGGGDDGGTATPADDGTTTTGTQDADDDTDAASDATPTGGGASAGAHDADTTGDRGRELPETGLLAPPVPGLALLLAGWLLLRRTGTGRDERPAAGAGTG